VKSANALVGLLAIFTAASCGNSSDSYSIVMVTVTAPPSMPAVVQLRADLANAGRSDVELFPQGQPTKAITFDTSFALALPTSRSGQLDITVSALDSAGRVVAAGSGSAQIAVGGRVDVTISLALPGQADAGSSDAGAGEAGHQVPPDSGLIDTRLSVDALPEDGPWGQDSLGPDGTGGTDVPLTGGAGGVGGVGGAGGVSGIGGATVGEGGRDAGVGGAGGVGGGVGYDAGVDVGGLGGGGGGWSTGGAGGTDARWDVASSDGTGGLFATGGAGGTGGISITGGVGGLGGLSTTGGTGGSGGTATSSDAGSTDAFANACSSTLPCPSYANCQGQPTCNPATGLCSAPTQCSVCGNGALEFSEQCDDGNTVSGDHCSSTCKTEFCGDGIVQSKALASLSLVYLARSCGVTVAQDIWMVLNGIEVVRGTVKPTCDCAPGIVTLPVTNPVFLALGKNGSNVVEVHTAAEISWAVVHYESPSGPGDVFLVDYGSNGAAQYRRPNLCTNGSYQGQEVATQMTLAGSEQCDDGNSNGVGNDPCASNCTLK